MLGSCAKPVISWRVAVLRFEDLTPGDGQTAWIGRAISEEIAGQLEGTRHNAVIPFPALHELDAALGARPISAPGISAERAAAIGAGANRIVTGFYTVRQNQLTITAVEEDVDTRKEAAPLRESGTVDDLLHLTDEIARGIDEEALPPITGSARALRSYALGLEAAPAESAPLYGEALRLDPTFGKPYVALGGMALQAHNTDEFGRIFQAMRAQGNSVRPVDRAVLNLEDARLHASASTRIDALGALVRLMPADPFRLQELANSELEANRAVEAADHYRKLAALLPSSAAPLNLLGYALMYAGDEPGAMKAFENYRRAMPGDANAIDSIGDAQFFFNHFKEAERAYLEAHGRNPNLLDGGELLKAAWARLMRNDQDGAGKLLLTYRTERGKAGDGLAPFRAAQMLRVMGRHSEAEQLMEPYTNSGSAMSQQAAREQLAWWRFLDGSGPAPEETSALGQAVGAFGRKSNAAAVQAARRLAENSSPNDWWTRTFYARLLQATGQTQEASRYWKYSPAPQPNRGFSLDELWWPWLLQARGKVE